MLNTSFEFWDYFIFGAYALIVFQKVCKFLLFS